MGKLQTVLAAAVAVVAAALTQGAMGVSIGTRQEDAAISSDYDQGVSEPTDAADVGADVAVAESDAEAGDDQEEDGVSAGEDQDEEDDTFYMLETTHGAELEK